MGFWKKYAEEIMARGYDDSDKSICAGCIGDRYFYNLIRFGGDKGKCSFCGKTRNVLPMNDILKTIAVVINRDYLPAEGNAIYDSDERKWWDSDHVLDPYDFVYNELNRYLESDNEDFLQELVDRLTFEDRMSVYTFRESREEIDFKQWAEYCKLVKETPLSAEQIVSLIKPGNRMADLPGELVQIQAVLELVLDYCDKFGLVRSIEGSSTIKKSGATSIFRCVNFLEQWNISNDDGLNNSNYAGLSFIPAMLVGTAPPKVVQDSRMSEKGDMMFYGADSIETAMIEVGKNKKHSEYPATIGTFHTNKQFRILDLSHIDCKMLPSIFDMNQEDKRGAWFFLNEFVRWISQAKGDDVNFYKPTQVFTKYIQRNTNLKGVKYKSSKSDGCCYTLFVVNRDCLDKGDRIDESRNQLIMENVEQIKFLI